MATYTFSAFTWDELFSGPPADLGRGDATIVPAYARALVTLHDDDDYLSGDKGDKARDRSDQLADIGIAGEVVARGARIYAESKFKVRDTQGDDYTLIEIEAEGPAAVGDLFTFLGDVPPAGARLVVISASNVGAKGVKSQDLGAGPVLDPDGGGPVDPPAPVTAADDRIRVFEDEGPGDPEQTADGAWSALDNDTSAGVPHAGEVVAVEGRADRVGQWIDLAKGRIRIDADGTVDFDAAGDFDYLDAGDTASVAVDYTISESVVSTASTWLDFAAFEHGDAVSSDAGISIRAVRKKDGSDGPNAAMIFDSGRSGTADPDLEVDAGNLLIITEDFDADDPDDNASGGTFYFDFDTPAHVSDIAFVDIEGRKGAEARFFGDDGRVIDTVRVAQTGDAGRNTQSFDIDDVARMEIELGGSGAIEGVSFVRKHSQPSQDTATIFVEVEGIEGPSFSLGGAIAVRPTHSVTLVIDHSHTTMNDGPPAPVGDLNGDGKTTVIDWFLTEIAEAAASMKPAQQIDFLLTGRDVIPAAAHGDPILPSDPLVGRVTTTAGELAAGGDLPFLLAPLSGTEGTETVLDVALALDLVRKVLEERGSVGAAKDDVVLLTSTGGDRDLFGTNGDLDDDGVLDRYESTYWPGAFVQGFTSNTSISGVPEMLEADALEALDPQGIDAEIDAILLDPSGYVDAGILNAIDQDDIARVVAGPGSLDLGDLIHPPADLAQVVGVVIDGALIAVDDTDPGESFQFTLPELDVNPANGVAIALDTDGDRATIEHAIDVTALLIGTAPDHFQFTLNLGDVLV